MTARRLFLAGLIAVLVGAPLVEAQEIRKPYRIGMLSPEQAPPGLVEEFRGRLKELGYIEGRTFSLELRNAGGDHRQLRKFADELVASKVDVIVAINTEERARRKYG
jgi:putative ABC transport system substrate-binding protein